MSIYIPISNVPEFLASISSPKLLNIFHLGRCSQLNPLLWAVLWVLADVLYSKFLGEGLAGLAGLAGLSRQCLSELDFQRDYSWSREDYPDKISGTRIKLLASNGMLSYDGS